MFNNQYICALDIGSSKIAAVAAKIKRQEIAELFFAQEPAKGVREGSIVDSIQLMDSISRVLKKLKAKSGINIKSIFANVCSDDISTKHAQAIIPLAVRGNKVITESDLLKVKEQAQILGSSLQEEIIHSIPYNYSIDSQENILNPLGLYSHKLQVDLYLVLVKLSFLQTLRRTIQQAGYELRDLFLSGIGTSRAVSNQEFENGNAVLCDIGSEITELLLFQEGRLRKIEILKTGGNVLTQELASELKVPFNLAEELKFSYVSIGDFENIPENKEILVKKDDLYKPIKQRLAAQIATVRTKSLCQEIKAAVEKLAPLHQVNNFFIAGRTLFLAGVMEMLETQLEIPVKLCRISCPELSSFIYKNETLAGVKYLTYLTSLGIICQALKKEFPASPTHAKPNRHPLFKAINRIKEVYQEYF